MDDPNPSPNLLCDEDKSYLNQDNTGNPFLDPSPSHLGHNNDDDDDYIKALISKEPNPFLRSNPFGSLSNYPSCFKLARFNSINWLLNAKMMLGFSNQTVYLSVIYLDRFLSLINLDENKMWVVKLLSISCLSLASKMETSKVTKFMEYPNEDGFGFDIEKINQMELLVLTTLGWKMNLVSPFSYFHYFVRKLSDPDDDFDHLLSKAIELVMVSIREVVSVEYRPCVVAVAAVLAAIDWCLSKEALMCKISTISVLQTSENEEELYTCYSLMQRLASNGNAYTPNSTQVNQELTTNASVSGAKRRLMFSDTDEDDNVDFMKIQRR